MLTCGQVPAATKQQLNARRAALDPMKLAELIEAKLQVTADLIGEIEERGAEEKRSGGRRRRRGIPGGDRWSRLRSGSDRYRFRRLHSACFSGKTFQNHHQRREYQPRPGVMNHGATTALLWCHLSMAQSGQALFSPALNIVACEDRFQKLGN